MWFIWQVLRSTQFNSIFSAFLVFEFYWWLVGSSDLLCLSFSCDADGPAKVLRHCQLLWYFAQNENHTADARHDTAQYFGVTLIERATATRIAVRISILVFLMTFLRCTVVTRSTMSSASLWCSINTTVFFSATVMQHAVIRESSRVLAHL